MTQAAVATSKTTRVIFHCNRCKHTWAKEYRTFIPTNSLYYMEEVNGVRTRHFFGDDANGRCVKCNSLNFDYNKVEGKVTGHVCGAKCIGAKSGTCECSCGGANHGISHM